MKLRMPRLPQMPEMPQMPWRALLIIFVVALVVRGLFFAADPNPRAQSGLTARQGEVARNIVQNGRWFVRNESGQMPALVTPEGSIDPAELDYSAADTAPDYVPEIFQPPGFSLLLAGAWELTGDLDYHWVQLPQILIDSLMVFVVFWISMQLFLRRNTALILV